MQSSRCIWTEKLPSKQRNRDARFGKLEEGHRPFLSTRSHQLKSPVKRRRHELDSTYRVTKRRVSSCKFKTLSQPHPCRFLREKSPIREFRLRWSPHMQEHIIQEEGEAQKVGVCARVRVNVCSLGWQAMAEASCGLREERWPGIPQMSWTAANSKLMQGVHLICCGCFEKNRKQWFQPWKLWGLLWVLR